MELKNIRFRDIAQREIKAQTELINRQQLFTQIVEKRKYLSPQELAESALVASLLAEVGLEQKRNRPEVCDPLFVGMRTLFNNGRPNNAPQLRSHRNGVLVLTDKGENMVVSVAHLFGVLSIDGALPPPVMMAAEGQAVGVAVETIRTDGTSDAEMTDATIVPEPERRVTIVPDTSHPAWPGFNKAFYVALGEVHGLKGLARLVLPILASEGDPDGQGGVAPSVDASEFARVMRGLAAKGVTESEPQLRRKVNEQLDRVQMVGDVNAFIDMGIEPPEWDTDIALTIIPEHVKAYTVVVPCAALDELKAFEVVDKIAEMFNDGRLSTPPGEAGKMLYNYWRDAPNRMSEHERRGILSATMGVVGGPPDGPSNSDFKDLWVRLASTTSALIRQSEVDNLLRAGIPSPISQQQVRKAARDLSANMSRNVYGMFYYGTLELQNQIKFMMKLLDDPELKRTFGADTPWDVIDVVATLHCGGARSSSRYRTLATCGTIMAAWLANNVNRINGAATGPLIDPEQVRNPPARLSGQKATTHPNDYDFVNACELYLLDSALTEEDQAEMARVRMTPTGTARPVPMPEMPAMAREIMDSMGDFGVPLTVSTRH